MSDEYEEEFLWPNPVGLLKALVSNSPELNVKVALISVIEYLVDMSDDDEEDARVVSANDMMEVMSQSLVYLHHHVGEEEPGDHEEQAPTPSTEELLRLFREQLGENNTTEEK